MKIAPFLILLAACGDNIHPAPAPDALVLVVPDPTVNPGDPRLPEPDAGVPDSGMSIPDAGMDAAVCDAGTLDAEEPEVCDDSHIELNGHAHKCQHDMPLP